MMNSFDDYPPEDLEAMGAGKSYTRWIHSFFQPYIHGSVAEVGAGIGSYSKLLLDTPSLSKLSVFEPSSNLFHSLEGVVSHHSKPTVCMNSTFNAEQGSPFNTIIYINVMEHIEDDVAEMKAVYNALEKGGWMLIFVPALPFLFSEQDCAVGHWRRYTKRELESKVESCGFKIEKLRYFDSLGVLSWLICCKWLRMIPGKKSVGVYDKLFVPVLRIAENIIAPEIGKNLLLAAQKQE